MELGKIVLHCSAQTLPYCSKFSIEMTTGREQVTQKTESLLKSMLYLVNYNRTMMLAGISVQQLFHQYILSHIE